MYEVDNLDAIVSVYLLWLRNVTAEKWFQPHYANPIDMLRRTVFQIFMLLNPNELMDFLALAYCIEAQYPEVDKMKKQV